MMSDSCDFAIIGAGMAGASMAAGLAGHGRVILLEAEDRPGYHATGRSAAFWTESYGGARVQPLTTASGPFLRARGLLRPRGALQLGRSHQAAAIDAFVSRFSGLGVRVERLGSVELARMVPHLRAQWQHGAWEPDCSDIDVAALHQLWLAQSVRAGVELHCRARLERAAPTGRGWRIVLADGRQIEARVLINAAGAWADQVARRAGLVPLGIVPYRRTMVQLRLHQPVPAQLPLTLGIDGTFYFKPEGSRLWLSPHDETPASPGDAAPEELDVATAIARFEQVCDWPVAAVERRWAGLRSFAADRLPVYGYDPAARGFFWCAAQGGFGIQTAPAAAELAVGLVLEQRGGAIDPAPFFPNRFR